MKLFTTAFFGVLSLTTFASAATASDDIGDYAMDRVMSHEVMTDHQSMVGRGDRNQAYKLRLRESQEERRKIITQRAQQEATDRHQRIAIRAENRHSIGPNEFLAIQNSLLNGEQLLPLILSERRAFAKYQQNFRR